MGNIFQEKAEASRKGIQEGEGVIEGSPLRWGLSALWRDRGAQGKASILENKDVPPSTAKQWGPIAPLQVESSLLHPGHPVPKPDFSQHLDSGLLRSQPHFLFATHPSSSISDSQPCNCV